MEAKGRFALALRWIDSRGHWFAILSISAITMLLYHDALSGWWTYDDPLHLKEAISHSPGEYFFIPHVWQEFQGGFFTPLLTLSYDVDFSLFGLNPELFYAHQLISLCLAAYSIYLLLSLWASRSTALLGAILLLVSPPFALGAHWLAIRHYVEGLAIACFALYAWTQALRRQSMALCWASAALYLLSMLAKEVYVPLAALMILLPERTYQERIKFSWPLWVSLLIYSAWRLWMLGGQIGGYGHFSTNWEASPDIVLAAILLMPFTFYAMLFGFNGVLSIWLGVFGAIIVSWIRHAPLKRIGVVLAYVSIICAPLVPVSGDFHPGGGAQGQRFVLLPAALIVSVFVLGLTKLASNRRALIIMLIPIVGIGGTLRAQSLTMLNAWKEPLIQEKEGKFLLEGSPESKALSASASNTNYFYRGIVWLRGHLGHGQPPAIVYGGYFGLDPTFDESLITKEFYGFEPSCACMRVVTEKVLGQRKMVVDAIADQYLEVKLRWGHGAIGWELGPYDNGSYFLLAGQQPGWYSSGRNIPKHGSIVYMLEGFMRVGYRSPRGFLTFSPEFHVNLAESGHFEWFESRHTSSTPSN